MSARVALLIDAENAPAAAVEFVLGEVARHGVAHVRRAYGNWKDPHLRPWEEVLHTFAIRPMQQFRYSSGKNASDMAVVIDAMDLMHAGNVDGIALMSSDADFTPLVMRLLADGLKVYGFGERKTPLPFTNACSQFTYVDEASSPASPTTPPSRRTPGNVLRQDTRLVRLLRGAVQAAEGEDGWALLSTVGHHISNQASLDPRNHGYSKLGELIEATGLFEVRRDGLFISVRDRRRNRAGSP